MSVSVDHPCVSVAVITYNHATAISQCLDSILSQSVDFDYEIVVGDDCSTDSTQSILQEYAVKYPNRFVLLLNQKNEGVSKNNINVLSRCRGEFVALCEGDDYWSDMKKLKRQVDFLRTNEECGFVGSTCYLLYPDGSMKVEGIAGAVESDAQGEWVMDGDVFQETMKGPVTRTATICFRRSIIKDYLQYPGAGNDTVLQAILAKHSLFARWTLPMAVYRIGGISNAHSSLEKELKYHEYVLTNRRLKNRLFPEDFRINENELQDRGDYIRLKYAIRDRNWRYALEIKKGLRSERYRNKNYAKYLKGPLSCFVLSCNLKHYG